jgi:hypothetical protein
LRFLAVDRWIWNEAHHLIWVLAERIDDALPLVLSKYALLPSVELVVRKRSNGLPGGPTAF